jgi:SanA protein
VFGVFGGENRTAWKPFGQCPALTDRSFMRRKRLLLGIGAAAAVAATASSWIVGTGEIVSPSSAPSAPVAIVPGAGVGPGGELSSVLADRLAVAVGLYHAGKVKKLLLSGDHGRERYDEPTAMARAVYEAGVPPEDVFLDHAGFDTHATLYRARHVFGVRRALVVSQEFHLPRALYYARRLGIEATGVRADRRRYQRRAFYAVRELVACAKAVLVTDVLRSRPRFLGPPISLEGDGRLTR